MDRVSTGSGSDLVKLWDSRMLITDQVATAPGTDVMQQAPPSVSAKLTDQSLIGMRLKEALWMQYILALTFMHDNKPSVI